MHREPVGLFSKVAVLVACLAVLGRLVLVHHHSLEAHRVLMARAVPVAMQGQRFGVLVAQH
jgi:hypothetical protein